MHARTLLKDPAWVCCTDVKQHPRSWPERFAMFLTSLKFLCTAVVMRTKFSSLQPFKALLMPRSEKDHLLDGRKKSWSWCRWFLWGAWVVGQEGTPGKASSPSSLLSYQASQERPQSCSCLRPPWHQVQPPLHYHLFLYPTFILSSLLMNASAFEMPRQQCLRH